MAISDHLLDLSTIMAVVSNDPHLERLYPLLPRSAATSLTVTTFARRAATRTANVKALTRHLRELGLEIVPFSEADVDFLVDYGYVGQAGRDLETLSTISVAHRSGMRIITTERDLYNSVPVDIRVIALADLPTPNV